MNKENVMVKEKFFSLFHVSGAMDITSFWIIAQVWPKRSQILVKVTKNNYAFSFWYLRIINICPPTKENRIAAVTTIVSFCIPCCLNTWKNYWVSDPALELKDSWETKLFRFLFNLTVQRWSNMGNKNRSTCCTTMLHYRLQPDVFTSPLRHESNNPGVLFGQWSFQPQATTAGFWLEDKISRDT